MNAAMAASYYARKIEDIVEELGTGLSRGLSPKEAAERLERFGSNELPRSGRRHWIRLLADQFLHPMILLLLGVIGIALVIGDFEDAAIVGVIVLMNAAIGFSQETKAERAMEQVRRLTTPEAKVLRGGTFLKIPSRDIVPGDIASVEAGDRIPADLRFSEAARLQVDESLLTGESEPVYKETEPVAGDSLTPGDQKNIGFMGTHVVKGRGLGIVFGTGSQTELGRIAGLLNAGKKRDIPLQKRLQKLTRHMAAGALVLCLLLFGAGLLRGEPLVVMLLTALSLAVAAIPEGLPAVITISLSLGALRLAKRGVLVRRLEAVEALGSITVICADKTGTLTENRMTVRHPGPGRDAMAPDFFKAILLCNDAQLPDHNQKEVGDPMEIALLQFASAAGWDVVKSRQEMPRVTEIPFDADRKRMTTLHAVDRQKIACMKGAPESVLEICRLSDKERSDAQALQENLSEQGLRVLAVAMKANVSSDAEKDFIFLGFIGLQDPPRKEAKKAIAECRAAGIRPLMITGDYLKTAQAIGRELGIGPDAIYARISPEDKLKIVRDLKSKGELVAMTGDGVNDAPALKEAHIGIAMGRGTDVAKEASALILTKENFETIVGAIREGRVIYDNIRKFVRYMLTTNLGEIATMLFAAAAGLPVPLLPIQILWMNLVTDGLPAVALGFEPAEGDVMKRGPRPPDENILGRGLWQHTLWVGILMGLLANGILILFSKGGSSLEETRTAGFTALTFLQMGHVLAIRSESCPLWAVGLFSNARLLIAVFLTISLQIALVALPFLQKIFHTRPLNLAQLFICFVPAMIVYVAVEAEKAIRRGQ